LLADVLYSAASAMETKAGDTANQAGMRHRRAGLPASRRWPRLLVVSLPCVTAFGCSRDRGGADSFESQAGVAPGQPSGTESSVGSSADPGSGSSTTSGRGSGSGSGSGSDSGSSATSGEEPGAAPGSPGGDTGPRPPSAPGAPGAPGAPTDPGDPGEEQTAPGAPIKIPSFSNRQNYPFDSTQADIEAEIVAACGGTQCLDIVVQREKGAHTSCFIRTEPSTGPPDEGGIKVPRGSRFEIIGGADSEGKTCSSDQSSDPGDPSGGQQPPSSS
jgi:hypothetical protein